MKEEILYRIVGVDSEVKRDMPDKFRSVLDNETYGTTYTEYDFKKCRYLFTFINDNFDIYDMLAVKDKEIRRLDNIINTFEEELEREVEMVEENTCLEHNTFFTINETLKKVLKRIKELKEGK